MEGVLYDFKSSLKFEADKKNIHREDFCCQDFSKISIKLQSTHFL